MDCNCPSHASGRKPLMTLSPAESTMRCFIAELIQVIGCQTQKRDEAKHNLLSPNIRHAYSVHVCMLQGWKGNAKLLTSGCGIFSLAHTLCEPFRWSASSSSPRFRTQLFVIGILLDCLSGVAKACPQSLISARVDTFKNQICLRNPSNTFA